MKKLIFSIITLVLLAIGANAQPWTQFTNVPTGTTQSLLSLHFVDDFTGYVVGTGGTILKTTDSGATWASQTSNSGNALYGTFFNDALKGWAVGDNGTILTTVDGGVTWTIVPTNFTEDFRVVWFLNANVGFIAGGFSGSSGIILRTTDGGNSWTDISPSPNNGDVIYGIFFTSVTDGYASDFDGNILSTTTGGNPWTITPVSAGNHLQGIYFTSPLIGYVVGRNFAGTGNTGLIYQTTTGGTGSNPWTLIHNEPAGVLTDIKFFGTTGVAVGGSVLGNTRVILKSVNGGAWLQETTIPTTVSRQVRTFLPCSHTGFSCGLDGSILKVTGLGEYCCDEFHDSFANTALLIQTTATSGTYAFPEPTGTLPGDLLTWDFGDGTILPGYSPFSPVHAYSQPGSYLASLCIQRFLPNGDTCKIKLCQLLDVQVTCDDCIEFIASAGINLAVDMSAWTATMGPVTFYPQPFFSPYNIRIRWDFDCDGTFDQTTLGNAPATANFPCGADEICYTVECLQSQQLACFGQSYSQAFNIPCPGNQGDCPNLVTNGEFELGDDGSFTSLALTECNGGCTTGRYCVGNNFQNKCNTWPNWTDHTSGTGNCLLIDGVNAGTGPFDIWRTVNIPVIAGTTYKFSFWVKSVYSAAQQPTLVLNATVMGAATTTVPHAILQTPQNWTKYEMLWVCPPTGTTAVDLSISQVTAGAFRDFGLDDISFSCIDCCDFMTDAMDFGIVGSGVSGNTYNFCLSPNISPSDIIVWDLDCDGTPDVPVSTNGNCATFTLIPSNSEICATAFHIVGEDTCRVKLNTCLPKITNDTCTCETLEADVDAGFTWNEATPGTVDFVPNSLTVCDEVEWLWGDNSSAISVGNTPISHTYAASGTHYVCMKVKRTLPNGNVCFTFEHCFNIMTVSATEEVLSSLNMTVTPNPNSGNVMVSLQGGYDYDNSFLRLSTVTGQVLQVVPMEAAEMQLNLHEYPAGLYLLSLCDEQGKLHLKPVKLMKQ